MTSAAGVASKPVLRRSEVQGLLGCPQWQSEPGGNAAKLGTLVHDLIRRHWDAGPEAFDLDVALQEAAAQPEVRGLTEAAQQDARKVFMHWRDRWRDRHAHLGTPAWFEHRFQCETPDAVLVGTPDAVWICARTLLVTDWKSTYVAPPADFQLKFYSSLLLLECQRAGLPIDRVVARVDPVRGGDDAVIERTWTPAEVLRWWQREVVSQIPRLLAERKSAAPPVGGAACQFCRKRMTCAAAITPWCHAPSNDEEAAIMAAELVRLEAATAAHREALQEFLANRAPIQVNGMEVGWLTPRKPSFRPTAEPLAIASWLDETGRNGAKVLSLKAAAIGRSLGDELAKAGLGRLEVGAPTFRTRKA